MRFILLAFLEVALIVVITFLTSPEHEKSMLNLDDWAYGDKISVVYAAVLALLVVVFGITGVVVSLVLVRNYVKSQKIQKLIDNCESIITIYKKGYRAIKKNPEFKRIKSTQIQEGQNVKAIKYREYDTPRSERKLLEQSARK